MAEEETRQTRPPEHARHATEGRQQERTQHQRTANRSEDERLITGIKDNVLDSNLVDVGLLFIRFKLSDPTQFLFTAAAERNLSCTMTISWPPQAAARQQIDPAVRKQRIELLQRLIDGLVKESAPQGHVTQANNEELICWLSYATAESATHAFRRFRLSLLPVEMGVNQHTRELIVDRPQA